MANALFVKGLLPMVHMRMSKLFGSDTRYMTWQREMAKGITMLNAEQNASSTAVMEGSTCTGFKMTWLKNCTPLSAQTCDTFVGGCDLTGPEQVEVDSIIYNPTCYKKEAFTIDDDLCDNEYKFEETFALELAERVKRLDIFLNREFYKAVAANTTPNIAPNSIGTVVGNVTNVQSGMWTPDILLKMFTEAGFNGLTNWVAFDGLNLSEQRLFAEYHRFNLNETHGALINNKFSTRLVFDDTTDAYQVTGRASTFLVDLSAFAFINRTDIIGDMTEIDASRNLYAWNVISPMTGVRYMVHYQKKCTGSLPSGKQIWKHIVNVSFYGGIIVAPEKCVGRGHALEYVNIP